jgi:cyclic pyranopterin phosphate synthase
MIEIYTDGACSGNPGPGGWAAIVIEDGATRRLHGREDHTTNNRMEMLAAIEGLEALPPSSEVTVFSDSTYVINTMTRNWKRKANQDLWARLDEAVSKRRVSWRWVEGHAGHPLNEEADRLARMESTGKGGRSNNPGPAYADTGDDGSSSHDPGLSHVDESGAARMVDVGEKPETRRVAVAKGSVLMRGETLELVKDNGIRKGDVLGVARVAGIMAAKNTSQLIPLCHPLPLDQVVVEFDLDEQRGAVDITATARTSAKTGVEMEALTAVSVAALTIYDMCKSSDRAMRIDGIRLARKSGGKSGDIVLEPLMPLSASARRPQYP